ncbi:MULTISPECIES: hypothetical protein [unclassified Streptomyces]|uniref:Uncharacterized protein n=1 Tax=Streptomyces sp. NBC_00119 TaxID=2975659 RepID=A0AAU1UM80_9ACTN|nr:MULTISPECIES: hypothetical protein [unclassified Streptomyces]MCX4649210.1 hypothetical protein [Streptomyces sp. NBC_01446]MCX5321581.1 hypothetical protein [Streptomyces sp. NBC_00120]
MSTVDSHHARSREGTEPHDAEEAIDFRAVRAAVTEVNDTPLAALERPGIEERTRCMAAHVRRMIRENGPDRPPYATSIFRAAYRVLDSPTRPTTLDSDWAAWKHLQNLAYSAAALVELLDADTA